MTHTRRKNITDHVKFGAMHLHEAKNTSLSPSARAAHMEAATMHAQAVLLNLRAVRGRRTRRTRRTRA